MLQTYPHITTYKDISAYLSKMEEFIFEYIVISIITICLYVITYIILKYLEYFLLSRYRNNILEIGTFTILFFSYIRILDIVEEHKRTQANFLIRYYLM